MPADTHAVPAALCPTASLPPPSTLDMWCIKKALLTCNPTPSLPPYALSRPLPPTHTLRERADTAPDAPGVLLGELLTCVWYWLSVWLARDPQSGSKHSHALSFQRSCQTLGGPEGQPLLAQPPSGGMKPTSLFMFVLRVKPEPHV